MARTRKEVFWMIAVNALKGLIVAQGLTQQSVAEFLGITPKTFYTKMQKGVFDSDEISQLISYLKIEDPIKIFFADHGTQNVPNENANAEVI
jgi:transcriptional regulator with XRE-family HTH domain